MLYDPKWGQETKTGPSLQGLIAWLETQPPEEVYNWYDVRSCVICQYVCNCGCKPAAYWVFLDSDTRCAIGTRGGWTFGAALARARDVKLRLSNK